VGFRTFLADQRGNTAIIFAFAIAPLIALSGGAVDLSNRGNITTKMQNAADTAALAAARTVQAASGTERGDEARWGKRKKDAESAPQDVFTAAAGTLSGLKVQPTIKVTKDTVTVSALADVPTSFPRPDRHPEAEAAALAEVGIPEPAKVEIALVLDYSGSMRENDKYIRMTKAAQEFIGKIGQQRSEDTKIGIVPFSEFVYATVTGGDVRGIPSNLAKSPMTVCLKNRDYPYSATADAPKGSVDGSRWPAADPAQAYCNQYGPNGLVARDLTSDFAGLQTALGQMQPIEKTNIALGTEIGWHMLSADAPFDQSSGSKDTQKVLIVLTDGVQTVEASGPGGQFTTLAADETTAELCQNAKQADIRIFSIAYDITDPRVRTLLSNCASDIGSYHEPKEANDISGVFSKIFDDINETVFLRR
jgi:Flp pilus assembly protein TadG